MNLQLHVLKILAWKEDSKWAPFLYPCYNTKLYPSHGLGFLFLKGENKKTFQGPFHQRGHTAPHAVPYIPFWTKVNKHYSNKTLSMVHLPTTQY